MIKISRGKPPKNNKLDSKKNNALNKIEKLVNSGKAKSTAFTPLWRDDQVKEFLHESQHGKCCYCERKRDEKRESDVEHFRPKAEVHEVHKHDGYWWLAYEWENLPIACKTCNQGYKKSQFPLEDESKRAYTKKDNVHNERPLLINPLEEDPSQFIYYDLNDPLMIKALGKCSRGQKTVDELTGINDRKVMMDRAEKLKYFKIFKLAYDLIENGGSEKNSKKNELQDMVQEYSSESAIFSGLATFYFKKVGLL